MGTVALFWGLTALMGRVGSPAEITQDSISREPTAGQLAFVKCGERSVWLAHASSWSLGQHPELGFSEI